MAVHNFRHILDVFPNGESIKCVATTQKGTKCGQKFFFHSDLSKAANILDEMDRSKDLTTSYQYLETLAYLTSCPRRHQKPRYSQVKEVSKKWRLAIAQYEEATANAAILKARHGLARLKGTEQVWMDGQDTPNNSQSSSTRVRNPKALRERQPNTHLSNPPTIIRSKASDDPFTSDTKQASTTQALLSEPSLFSPRPSLGKYAQPNFSQSPVASGSTRTEKETANIKSSVPLNVSFPPTSPATSEKLAQGSMLGNEELPSTPLKGLFSGQKILSPETPVKTAPIINKDSLNREMLSQPDEECFGYAIVTPESQRFKTYLPARHRFGQMTPPDTPDASAGLEIKTGSFQDFFPGFAVRPAISRKPLPTSPTTNVVMCGECGYGHDGCRCICAEWRDDETVKAGCFHRIGLRRLKSKIVKKVNSFRTKMSGIKLERRKH